MDFSEVSLSSGLPIVPSLQTRIGSMSHSLHVKQHIDVPLFAHGDEVEETIFTFSLYSLPPLGLLFYLVLGVIIRLGLVLQATPLVFKAIIVLTRVGLKDLILQCAPRC